MVRSTGRRLCLALLAASLLLLPWRPLLASPAEDLRAASTSWLEAFLAWFDVSGRGQVAASEAVVPSLAPPAEPRDPEGEATAPEGAEAVPVEQEQESGPYIDPNG